MTYAFWSILSEVKKSEMGIHTQYRKTDFFWCLYKKTIKQIHNCVDSLYCFQVFDAIKPINAETCSVFDFPITA
jgi:hypothetical protein